MKFKQKLLIFALIFTLSHAIHASDIFLPMINPALSGDYSFLETDWSDVRALCDKRIEDNEVFNQKADSKNKIASEREARKMPVMLAYTGTIMISSWDWSQQPLVQEKSNIEETDEFCIAILEEKLTLYPDSVQIRNHLVVMYARRNELDNAERHIRFLLEKDSTDFFAINNLGNIFFKQGKLDSAYKYYNRALDYAPYEYQDGIYLNLGLIYFAAGLDSLAIDKFSLVMGDSAGYRKVANMLGITLEEIDLVEVEKSKRTKKISATSIVQIIAKARERTKIMRKPRAAPKTKKDIVDAGGKNYLPSVEIDNCFYWAF